MFRHEYEPEPEAEHEHEHDSEHDNEPEPEHDSEHEHEPENEHEHDSEHETFDSNVLRNVPPKNSAEAKLQYCCRTSSNSGIDRRASMLSSNELKLVTSIVVICLFSL